MPRTRGWVIVPQKNGSILWCSVHSAPRSRTKLSITLVSTYGLISLWQDSKRRETEANRADSEMLQELSDDSRTTERRRLERVGKGLQMLMALIERRRAFGLEVNLCFLVELFSAEGGLHALAAGLMIIVQYGGQGCDLWMLVGILQVIA